MTRLSASLFRRVLREPLLHFVWIAAALFALDALWNDQRDVIHVGPATIEFLAKQRSELLNRKLTGAERRRIVEEHIDQEVLVREAYARGLDRGARIRGQLINKVKFLLAEKLPEPTDAELRAFFKENAERFALPASVTLDHVYYRDRDGVPDALRAALIGGLDPTELGDFHASLGRHVAKITWRELLFVLGPKAAKAIFGLPEGEWHGPIESRLGVHFVRVTQRLPAQPVSYEQIAHYMPNEWVLAQRREAMEEKMIELRRRYRVTTSAGVLP